MFSVKLNKNDFKSLIAVVDSLTNMQCSEMVIRDGIIRQTNNSRKFVIYVNLQNILRNNNPESIPDIVINNLSQKSRLLKSLAKHGTDIMIEIYDGYYIFSDTVSKIKFWKPCFEYMYTKTMTHDELFGTMKLLDAPPIFSYKFDKYLVDRIVSGHKILQNKHIDVIIENNNVKFLMNSAGMSNSTSIIISEMNIIYNKNFNITIPIELFLIGCSEIIITCKKTEDSNVFVNEFTGYISEIECQLYHMSRVHQDLFKTL